jgi:hypothetical protein
MHASLGIHTRPYLHALHAFIEVMLVSGIAHANTNLLNNGSFEIPSVPPSKLTNFKSGSSAISGWSVVGPETSVVSGKFTSFLVQFPASDGSQWLDLTGYLSTSSGASNKLSLPRLGGHTFCRLRWETSLILMASTVRQAPSM